MNPYRSWGHNKLGWIFLYVVRILFHIEQHVGIEYQTADVLFGIQVKGEHDTPSDDGAFTLVLSPERFDIASSTNTLEQKILSNPIIP